MKAAAAAWVTAKDIENWSKTSYKARFILSRIVRHVVLASTEGTTKIDFPSEEEVARSGFDGVLRVKEGNSWVPKGASYWELGTGSSAPPQRKANSDYQASLKKATAIERRQGTFIFVTTQPWNERGREAWAKKKKASNQWRDVRVLDCSSLAEWLDTYPPAAWRAAWLIRNGKCPPDTRDAAGHWDNLRDLANPALTPECFLCGRDRELSRLGEFLNGPPQLHAIHGESPEEVVDFIAAALATSALAFQCAQARCLVIESKESWRIVVASADRGVIMPRGFDPEPELLREATRRKLHVILPADMAENGNGLRRLPIQELEQALEAAGYEASRAKQVARQSGGSSSVLKRLLIPSEQVRRPPWAEPSVAAELAGFLLVGACQDANPLDRNVVSAISGIPEPDLDRIVQRWASGPDRLFRKTEFGWRLASVTDAWHWLSRYLTKRCGEAFVKEAIIVLGWEDSRFDVQASRRMPAIHNDPKRYSPELRRGLVEALTLSEVSKDKSNGLPNAGVQPAIWRLFGELFPKSTSTKHWATLNHLLPLLAEGMPTEFLEAVERDLERSPSPFCGLFERDTLFIDIPHVGLIWALEILAWSPQYLLRAALCLARLARLDAGGSTNPRPRDALAKLFFPRLPQTNTTSEFRLKVLDSLVAHEPDIGWNLLLDLLPGMGGICIHNSQPRWRSWAAGWSDSLSEKEVQQQTQAILDRVISLAKAKPVRLVRALEEVAKMPGVSRRRIEILEAVRDTDPGSLTESDREALWNGLREVVQAHRRHPHAWWSLPSAFVDGLDSSLKGLEPSDPVKRLRWLFQSWPDLPGITTKCSTQERQRIIYQARLDAMREVMVNCEIEGVLALIRSSHDSWLTGLTAGEANLLRGDQNGVLFERLANPDQSVSDFACGYLRGQFNQHGWDWIRTLPTRDWSSASLALLALALPFEARVWDWLASKSPESLDIYWQRANGYHRQLPMADCERAVKAWIRVERAVRATGFLSMMVTDGLRPAPALVFESLEALGHHEIKSGQDAGAAAVLGHEVAELLDYLHAGGGSEHLRLVQLEWTFFPFLASAHREPKAFFSDLETNPSRFVELVCLMYRPEGVTGETSTDQAQVVANQAEKVLEMWRKLPGETADRSLDGAVLQNWCAEVRRQLIQCQRKKPGEFRIGCLLGHAPQGSDGIWPHEEVRVLIEAWKSENLESGISSCRRKWHQPGEAEIRKALPLWESSAHDLASDALKLAGTVWLRTAALLDRLAQESKDQAAWRQQRLVRFAEE